MEKKIVVFDLNGTLLKDTEIWYGAVKAIFAAYKKKPPTIAEYFEKLTVLKSNLQVYRSYDIDGTTEQLDEIYIPAYESQIPTIKLFPNVVEILEYLSATKFTIGLITAQEERIASPILEKLKIDGYFAFAYFNVRDKTATIAQILKDTDTQPKKCFIIGDAPSDIEYGNMAGIETIAFVNSYIPESLLMAANPIYCIRDLSEIATIIQ
ncbi:MAG: HAD family hydrolase [Minisyncoccales bacterium]